MEFFIGRIIGTDKSTQNYPRLENYFLRQIFDIVVQIIKCIIFAFMASPYGNRAAKYKQSGNL